MDNTNIVTIMKALSDENRISIVSIIAKQDNICACKILEDLGITQPTLSYHMRILCSCGLIACQKQGKWMHYSINPAALSEIQSFFESLEHKAE